MKYCFGVDVGGTSIKMGLFREDGDLLEKWEIVTRQENHSDEILPDIAESVSAKIKEYRLTREMVTGIGIGVPAPVTEDGIVNGCANLGWEYKEVKREMESLTGLLVRVGNDANVAALGEMWKGAGAGQRNLVMVTLGTGVGGGLVVGGKAIAGAHGAGGEIGHMCVNYKEKEVCGCGNSGCLEQYASATGIVRIAKKRLEGNSENTVLTSENLTAKQVFDAVKAGDQIACEIAEEFGNYMGHALANIAAIVDPAVIVFGGGVSRAGEILLDYVRKPYQERAFFADRAVKFVLAELGNDAGIYGAAKLILE
ncbi:MAG: ROK family glucokinase [Hespellia sp.]|nr:ROK family glucokinase [Hespellia sp.]